MKTPTRIIVVLLVMLAVGQATARAQAGWDSVAAILRTPALDANGYQRFNLPRADLTVRIGDVTVAAALASGAWVGFAGPPDDADMMGDLVLVASELAPVQAQLSRDGIEATAIHNHLAGEVPTLTYLHVHAHGPASAIAGGLARAVALTGTPLPVAAGPAPAVLIDTARVFAALGVRGRGRGAVAQIAPVRISDTVRLDGRTLVPALAYASPVNIQQVSADRYVATGDFAVTAVGVQPVLHALAGAGITATALHSHLVGEAPKVSYIHFWADGTPERVLGGLRAALDVAR